jgi:hypothetical protein
MPRSEFWASNVWELTHAFEGYAMSKGIKKKFDESLYPSKAEREELHKRIKNG